MVTENTKPETQSQSQNQNQSGDTVTELKFRFGHIGPAIPMLFFMFWAVLLSVMDVVTENGLVVGATIGLAIGLFLSLLSKISF
jgi:hypothetical protein